MSNYHRFLQIQAYKHNGSFHRLWSHGLVVRDDEDYIVEVSYRVRVIESNQHVWHTREPAVFIFSKKLWFNTVVTIKEDGLKFYVNIATPAIIDQGFIKFIDYDLDLKIFPDGSIKVLDVNEFNIHCGKYNYSNDLQKILIRVLGTVTDMAENHQDPFNKETIDGYFADYQKFIAYQEEKDKRTRR